MFLIFRFESDFYVRNKSGMAICESLLPAISRMSFGIFVPAKSTCDTNYSHLLALLPLVKHEICD